MVRMSANTAIPLQHEDDFYPTSDGKPMAETQTHLWEMMNLITALEDRYRDDPDVYVVGNMLLYYVQGDSRSVVSPDVFVVKGIPKRVREIYKLWEEGEVPCFVIEVTSKSTRNEDLERKRVLYERLGVEEYILHDPLGEYLRPSLQGFRLVGGRYQKIDLEPDGTLVSRTTGLRLCREGEHLRLLDLETGQPLMTDQEARNGVRRTEAALESERAARRALEEELARVKRELETT